LLKLLDVIIGVATVMLLFSMAVTVITHFVTSVIGSRGRNLLNGLSTLLQQLDPTLEEKVADTIATTVLKQPMLVGRLGALGTVIHREELTIVLMELAAGETPKNLEAPAKEALLRILQKNGVSDAAGTLKNIRDVALQLEAADPALATNVRHSMAILQEAKSEYVAKIHGWFDQTIDRVSQRFTLTAHGITFVAALLVAFGAQLDTIALINRLSLDDSFRAALVNQSQSVLNKAGSNTVQDNSTSGQTGSGSSGQQQNNAAQNQQPDNDTQNRMHELLRQDGLLPSPSWSGFKSMTGIQFLGIMLSALLLSLGAPFWYSSLQNLVRLRSAIAQKDDQQRNIRQTSQADGTVAAAAVVAMPAILQGEQGDLTAVG
jgi:hypothetical protein